MDANKWITNAITPKSDTHAGSVLLDHSNYSVKKVRGIDLFVVTILGSSMILTCNTDGVLWFIDEVTGEPKNATIFKI